MVSETQSTLSRIVTFLKTLVQTETEKEGKPKRNLGWVWLLVGLALGIGLALLLRNPIETPQAAASSPDTITTLAVDSSGVKPPPPPQGTGQARPTAETTFVTNWRAYWPDWWVPYLRYQDDALKLVAVRKLQGADSVEALSQTYYAPGGFQVRVADSVYVDTFPQSASLVAPAPSARQHWLKLSGVAELDTHDGLGAGVELGITRFARLQGFVGVSRICAWAGVQKWPADSLAPWARLRLQIVFP